MKKTAFVLAPISVIALAAPSPLDRLPAGPAGAIVRRAIDHTGGWEAWASKKTVQFRKTVVRYRPDGSVERRRVQFHRYVLRPEMKGRIEFEEDGKKIVFVNSGNQALKLVDGRAAPAQEDINSARNNTFGSHYVFSMPFKLTDPGVHLEPAGEERVGKGSVAQKVRVTYDKGAGDAGGMHVWTYYFEKTTGRLVANNLQYEAAKYDYTEYLDEKPVAGLLLPMKRLGYEADAKGKKGRRNSEILYEDVRFDVPMEDALFALPRR
jgi:hypothetical protein